MTTDSFVVCMTNQGIKYFEEAQNAVDYAASKLYVGYEQKDASIRLLNAGQLAEWAYGFNEVTIFPPGVTIK